ncbi:hypothetical protein HMPREF0322_03465 [Desulfitobacterium hafniense DP7]|uniref:Uncharacterized protein n=1 Tax=Desulfitobacterium hafniense DP7 TaxID=537010 RepID=G9XR67_DESHA|nr:hypothetical protein HMPREF0322_03465 [Desulfitobacterium hafniense DP7]
MFYILICLGSRSEALSLFLLRGVRRNRPLCVTQIGKRLPIWQGGLWGAILPSLL